MEKKKGKIKLGYVDGNVMIEIDEDIISNFIGGIINNVMYNNEEDDNSEDDVDVIDVDYFDMKDKKKEEDDKDGR